MDDKLLDGAEESDKVRPVQVSVLWQQVTLNLKTNISGNSHMKGRFAATSSGTFGKCQSRVKLDVMSDNTPEAALKKDHAFDSSRTCGLSALQSREKTIVKAIIPFLCDMVKCRVTAAC